MTYTLQVKNPCRCFLRNGGIETQTFTDMQEAEEEAQSLLETMQKTYCKKHQFALKKIGSIYTITISPRT